MSQLGEFSVTLAGDEDLILPPPARRALEAIRRDRGEDARRHAAALKTDPLLSGLYWAAFFEGLIAAHGDADGFGADEFFRAAGIAFAVGSSVSAFEIADRKSAAWSCELASRLAALAWEYAGRAQRRQEKLDRALTTHAAAYALRKEHGHAEECWESAMSAGQDAVLWRKHEESESWFDRALFHAEKMEEPAWRHRAESLEARAKLHLQAGSISKAVTDARLARSAWLQFDSTAVHVPRADLLVARTLLRKAELFGDEATEQAAETLSEAVALLTSAAESFAAFGPGFADDARLTVELLDLASRLSPTPGAADSVCDDVKAETIASSSN